MRALSIWLVAALSLSFAGGAIAAPHATCAVMVGRLQAYLQAHPGAAGTRPQTKGAQLMHQPTVASVAKARQESRESLGAMLAKASARQVAGDEAGCRAALVDIEWMLHP